MWEPMLATPGSRGAFATGDWVFEIKWDGYRAVATVGNQPTVFTSRRGIDLTEKYPELQRLGDLLAGTSAVLDGEIVVLDDQARSNFELLQQHGHGGVVARYVLFDILQLEGTTVTNLSWRDRRALLEDLVPADDPLIMVPPILGNDAELALATAEELDLEGIVGKRSTSRYWPGKRHEDWLKVKRVKTQDVIIVGWQPGKGNRSHTIGSLLMAVPREGRLCYVGRVGSGFSDTELAETAEILAMIGRKTPALEGVPREEAKDSFWVEPFLVAEVRYNIWLANDRLRHPVWRGWRPDIQPEEVALPASWVADETS